MTLLGETQEEDRRLIADLCLVRMQQHLKPVTTLTKATSSGTIMHQSLNGGPQGGQQPPQRQM